MIPCTIESVQGIIGGKRAFALKHIGRKYLYKICSCYSSIVCGGCFVVCEAACMKYNADGFCRQCIYQYATSWLMLRVCFYS